MNVMLHDSFESISFQIDIPIQLKRRMEKFIIQIESPINALCLPSAVSAYVKFGRLNLLNYIKRLWHKVTQNRSMKIYKNKNI